MKTYIAFIDTTHYRKNSSHCYIRTHRMEIEAENIISASAKGISKIGNIGVIPPQVSMIWPKV